MPVNRKRMALFIAAVLSLSVFAPAVFAGQVKMAETAGIFYPVSKEELSAMLASFLAEAGTGVARRDQGAKPLVLIVPHAGYPYSGRCAARAYSLVREKQYSTVVVIGPAHHYGFEGISVWPEGYFRTPLGDIPIDKEFAGRISCGKLVRFEPRAFAKEHSVEVQLPFLQSTLSGFKLVPLVIGNCGLEDCRELARRLKEAIGNRTDVLVVASTDLYHGYDPAECDAVDGVTCSAVETLDAGELHAGIREGRMQMCGGSGVVASLLLAKGMGCPSAGLLERTNSGKVTGNERVGQWTVGYAGFAVYQRGDGEGEMLDAGQKKKLLSIARRTIETYLKTGRKPELTEDDPLLKQEMGAFVTLHKHGELRGCIGSMVGTQPLFLTVRDMAVESSTGDPRFSPVTSAELKDIDIEISVLSPLEKVGSAEEIALGTHGVLVRRGFNSGVFLPQVADETGWSKEEFLSYLCSHKAGLPADAWKDAATELFVFTASVFSEKELDK